MGESTKLPPFFRDFHDQKDFAKAFYVWMGMMDSKANSDGRSEFFKIHRPQMCSWVDFTVLMATLLDFLAQHGWVLRRARGWRNRPDVAESVKSLNDLENAWYALVDPDDVPRLRDDLIDQYMKGWEPLLKYMPDNVQAAWNALKLARPQDTKSNQEVQP